MQDEEGNVRKQLADQSGAPEYEKLLHIRAATFNNLAATQIKIEAYPAALKSVDSALEIEPSNIKALFRKAKILDERGEVDDALKVLNSALSLGRNGNHQAEMKLVQKEIARLSAKQRDQRLKEKELAQRMLRALNDPDKSTQRAKGASNRWALGWGLAAAGLVAAGSAVAYRLLLGY